MGLALIEFGIEWYQYLSGILLDSRIIFTAYTHLYFRFNLYPLIFANTPTK